MKNSKRILIISIITVISICLFSGMAVFAVGLSNTNSFKQLDNFKKDGVIRKMAQVESISDKSITLILGTEPENLNEKSNNTSQENTLFNNFEATGEKITLTFSDSSEVEGIKTGDIVMVIYNDQNELLKIKNASEISDKSKKGKHQVARIDEIEGSTVTVTYGTLEKPETTGDQSESSQSDLSKSFKEGTEQKTLTVKDTSNLEGLKTGSIVIIELSNEDENVIEKIRDVSEMKRGMKENHQIARIDNINGNSITVTLGTLEKSENTENSSGSTQPDFTKNFKAGSEQKTYSVKESEVLNGLKTGDIVMLEINEDDQNVIDEIHSVNEISSIGFGHGHGSHGGRNMNSTNSNSETQNNSTQTNKNNTTNTINVSI